MLPLHQKTEATYIIVDFHQATNSSINVAAALAHAVRTPPFSFSFSDYDKKWSKKEKHE